MPGEVEASTIKKPYGLPLSIRGIVTGCPELPQAEREVRFRNIMPSAPSSPTNPSKVRSAILALDQASEKENAPIKEGKVLAAAFQRPAMPSHPSLIAYPSSRQATSSTPSRVTAIKPALNPVTPKSKTIAEAKASFLNPPRPQTALGQFEQYTKCDGAIEERQAGLPIASQFTSDQGGRTKRQTWGPTESPLKASINAEDIAVAEIQSIESLNMSSSAESGNSLKFNLSKSLCSTSLSSRDRIHGEFEALMVCPLYMRIIQANKVK